MKPFVLILLIYLLPLWTYGKISKSNDIFLPSQQGLALQDFQQTPITWWNFLFYNSKSISKDKICEKISNIDPSIFIFNPCQTLPLNLDWINTWSKEYLLHSQPPKDINQIKSELTNVLTRLSLPLPTEQLEIIRQNPLAPFSQLEDHFASFFQSPPTKSSWKSLPFLLNYPPSQLNKTEENFKILLEDSSSFYWAGPHIGVYENQKTIMTDIKKVLLIGTILLISLLLFLILKGQLAYLLLIPILLFSTFIAYLGVELIWGSIHGLTLAFGSGLIGISMDYAFHGWKTKHMPSLWKTNSIGFLTTFTAFLLLSLFSIPLLKQISVFTCLGLASAFLFSFALSRLMDQRWQIQSFLIPIYRMNKRNYFLFISLFALSSLIAASQFHYDFSLNKMDYSNSKIPLEIKRKEFSNQKHQFGFLQENKSEADKISKWALTNNISILSAQQLIPDENTSATLKSWINWACPPNDGIEKISQPPFSIIFKEFFEYFNCQNLSNLKVEHLKQTENLFTNNNSKLFILKAKSPSDSQLIKNDWPNAFFISEFTRTFSQKMKVDTKKYLLFITTFISLILIILFKRKFLLVTLPTLGALMGLSIMIGVNGKPASFMTFIGVLILLGLTLDYGIFCTTFLHERKSLEKVFAAITLSAITSICGFAPLFFCTHPVLQDLGRSIISGLIGACIITYTSYPLLNSRKA